MRESRSFWALGLTAVLWLSACSDDSDTIQPEEGCRACHGNNRSAAPPKSLGGSFDPSDPAVGAHEAHLFGAKLGRPVQCTECHLVPDELNSPGHIDSELPAELSFGPLAKTGAVQPTWDRAALRCGNTYCHGATLEGGTMTQPIWNMVDGSQSECGACHGMPPPAPHPKSEACELCHTPVVGPDFVIATPMRHGDGIVDVVDAGEGCSACHGSKLNAAPPKDLAGLGELGSLSVGAHQTHLAGGRNSAPVPCKSCHLVPVQIDDPGHVDTEAPAELTFGELAIAHDAQPAWDRDLATCSNTYCHGTTLAAGGKSPNWTVADGTEAACGTCHALPPPAPHPDNDRCEMCHLPTAGPNQTIANRDRHVDGILQVSLEGCTGCHGTEENLAPPVDTQGQGDTQLRSVGAHQTHLSGGRNSHPVACESCHLVPSALDDPGHRDTALPAELTFSGMSAEDGAMPQWIPESATCANSYCHGATITGGTNVDPVWTTVNGSEAACGSCHGLPPPAPHPQSDACQLCHGPTAGPAQTIADRSTHIDGILQANDGTCVDCHGSDVNAAPPIDTQMQSDTTLRSVGAHRAHTVGTRGISRPVACTECHIEPENSDDPGHIDTELPAELNFGPLASWNSTTPSFDPVTLTCSGTYCHGALLSDGVNTTPNWVLVDGSQSACGTCHGAPPANNHPADDRCELCHLPTAGPNQTIADVTTHIDGILQASADCDSCHGENGVSAPPLGLDGQTASTDLSVGAHRAHLSGGVASKPVACTECHVVPQNLDSPGHIDTDLPAELNFGPIAGFGSSPSWSSPTCNNTYCHAGTDAQTPSPTWNVVDGSQSECGDCHGMPPNTPSHQGAQDCTNCHLPTAGPNQTIANRDTHVDGILQVADLDCGSCHGDATSAAPPIDLDMDTAPTDPQVGTHQAHLAGGQFSKPVACSTCHLVPVTTNEAGHLDTDRPAEVIFGGIASNQQTSPIFDGATLSCSDSYCHGGATSLGTTPDPIWNQPGTAPCGGCHGLPPAAPHPQIEDCQMCHAPVAGPNQTIADRSRHVDGIEDVNVPQTCETCHGTPASAAPPPDLAGNNNGNAVGAHTAHLQGRGLSLPVPCSECHTTVNDVEQAGHYDTDLPAEVIFGVLSRRGGSNPTKNGLQCNNTYCHGNTLPGGTNEDPTWTQGTLACDACHGAPPPDAVHGNGTATQCEACHPDTAGPNQTIVNPAKHIDGVIDTSAGCDVCHGAGGDPTPPNDLAGLSQSPKVGAHAAHRAPQNSASVACQTCHLVPTNYSDPGHADTAPPAEVSLLGRAVLDGSNPTYNAGQLRCDNSYCHGRSLPGGKTSVTWDDADGSESQCGACHGMPPADGAHAAVNGPDTCNLCHEESAGANQTIINPSLHLDGVVQVSGGACDSCHGSPPAPGNESYAGSAGAHATHAGTLGFECSMCHGNNGDGPNHDQGNGTVSRNNVDLVFDQTVSYPGGTTMRNGGDTSYSQNNKSCAVGCHNPLVGNPNESPNLNVQVTWGATNVTCVSCHDSESTAAPRNHNLAGLGDAGCMECHDQSQHTQGATRIRDPDPNDGFSYAANNLDGLCKTCHDGGAGTFFGGQTAPNVTPFWTVSSHGAEGYQCADCHTYHGSTNGPVMLDRANATCLASGCHANLNAEFSLVSGGPISHHRIEGGNGIQLLCVNCHNPHLAQPHPLAAANPDNKWQAVSLPDAARNVKKSSGNYSTFCLSCHDGTPPPGVQGAMNIAQALSGGSDPSMFRKEGQESLHRKKHSGYNCQNCHLDHGSTGTAGINRGRLLRDYMNVRQFSQTQNYTGENSCGTGRPMGATFGCH